MCTQLRRRIDSRMHACRAVHGCTGSGRTRWITDGITNGQAGRQAHFSRHPRLDPPNETCPTQVPGTPRLHLILVFERRAANDAGIDRRDLRAWQAPAVLECWSAGVLECWSAGVLECCSARVLECWSAGVLECCSAAVLECCSAAVLQCCSLILHSDAGYCVPSYHPPCRQRVCLHEGEFVLAE